MVEKFLRACAVLLYGRIILKGYYEPSANSCEKNYIFSSVFPSQDSMDRALAQTLTRN